MNKFKLFLFLTLATISLHGSDDPREYVSAIYSNLHLYQSQDKRDEFVNTCSKFNNMNGNYFSLGYIETCIVNRSIQSLESLRDAGNKEPFQNAAKEFIVLAGVLIVDNVKDGYKIRDKRS